MLQASLRETAGSADCKKEEAGFMMIDCGLSAHFVGKHRVIKKHQFLMGGPRTNPEAPTAEVKSGEGDVATTMPAEAWFIRYDFMNMHRVLA